MRRITLPLLTAFLLVQALAFPLPAEAALPAEVEALWNKVEADYIEVKDYFDSQELADFSQFFGENGRIARGLSYSASVIIANAESNNPSGMSSPAPGESGKTRQQVINDWMALCLEMDKAIPKWGESIKLMRELLELRLQKDPNWDYRQYIELGTPSLVLNDMFFYILGRGPVVDGYATGGACTIAAVNAILTAVGSSGGGEIFPYPAGPITSSLKNGRCFYAVQECQPAFRMTWTPSPSSDTASLILGSTAKANSLVLQLQETLAKERAESPVPTDTNPVKGIYGSSVVSLPLPLSNISVPQVIGRVMNAVLGIVGGLALLLFVWGGLRWMLARGNPEEVGKAKNTIIWAALGLIAIFSSYAILNFIITALRS